MPSEHSELERRRLHLGKKSSPTRLFTELRITFKKGKRKTFWQANEGELEYLYHDLVKAVNETLFILHPDRGGNGELFIEFKKESDAVKAAFHRKGVAKIDPLVLALREEEKHPIKIRKQKVVPPPNPYPFFKRSTPVKEILALLQQDYHQYEIEKMLNTTRKTIVKVGAMVKA